MTVDSNKRFLSVQSKFSKQTGDFNTSKLSESEMTCDIQEKSILIGDKAQNK